MIGLRYPTRFQAERIQINVLDGFDNARPSVRQTHYSMLLCLS